MRNSFIGYRVADIKNRAYSFRHHDIETCKKYCRKGSAIYKEYSVLRGFKIKVFFMKPSKIISFYKFSSMFHFNIYYLHISSSLVYLNKVTEEVWRPKV